MKQRNDMQRGVWVIVASLLSFTLVAGGRSFAGPTEDGVNESGARETAQRLDPREHKVGRLIPDFEFTTIDGKKHKLSGFQDKAAIVLAYRTIGCPLSKKFTPALKRVYEQFKSQNVVFFVVDPGETDLPDKIRAAHKQYQLKIPTIHDPENKIAGFLGANRTTDTFVLGPDRTLIYRGAINDQYGLGFSRTQADRHFLVDAISSFLKGQRLEVPATSAPGCELPKAETAKETPGKVTWHNRISRIVQQNCQECHRPGENGPFELMTYKDVKSNRGMIERVISDKTMPPWFASKSHGDFANDRSLSKADRGAMLSWIKDGCPKGDEVDAANPAKFYQGWRLGRPDAIVAMPRPIAIPAEGVVPYKYVKVRSRFSEDKWVRGIEIRPGAAEVVHHVLIFIRYPYDHPRAKEQPRQRGGLRGYFAGMVPGQSTLTLPKGCAKFLPKGAEIVFQLHYTPNGLKVKDRTRMGLYFGDKPKHEVRTYGIADTRFRIPPHAANHVVTKSKRLNQPMRVLSLAPHMHLRGKTFLYEAILPNGKKRTLLDVPFFDFNWQLTYEFREPIDLPAGTVIKVTASFDNSAKNVANPNPAKEVRFGEQTFDEMMIGYFTAYPISAESVKKSDQRRQTTETEAKPGKKAEPKPAKKREVF